VDAVIAMGRRLSLRLVAEGVENAEQLKFLRSRGCDFGRGYFLGRSVPAGEFERLFPFARSD
jgi:EAL domain-containing protein (putative c-di-GMP-specific phosphodiesterase class I)